MQNFCATRIAEDVRPGHAGVMPRIPIQVADEGGAHALRAGRGIVNGAEGAVSVAQCEITELAVDIEADEENVIDVIAAQVSSRDPIVRYAGPGLEHTLVFHQQLAV